MPRDEEDVVAICVDCGSPQRTNSAEKDPFLQSGQNGVCKMCGGVVIVTYSSEIQAIMDRRRNGEVL